MAHPFAKKFETALRTSTPLDNKVLEEAEKLKEKGYSTQEIYEVLVTLTKGCIDDTETEILTEAAEEFSRYLA